MVSKRLRQPIDDYLFHGAFLLLCFRFYFITVAEVIARSKSTPPNPAMIIPPQGDLAAALRNGPTDPDFNLKTWEQEWADAEAEVKRINRLNDMVKLKQ
jgi:hypothetical protein